jgi:hypothetical protein
MSQKIDLLIFGTVPSLNFDYFRPSKSERGRYLASGSSLPASMHIKVTEFGSKSRLRSV